MTKLMIVYTLNPGINERTAIDQLVKTGDELPSGASLRIARRSDPEMEVEICWVPFGDLVQIIEFEKAYQASEFDDTDAAKHQAQRTKGFFSNIAKISCPIVE